MTILAPAVDHFSQLPSDLIYEISWHLNPADQLNLMKTSSSLYEKGVYKQIYKLNEEDSKELFDKLGFVSEKFQKTLFHELELSEGERRWFELRILNAPPKAPLESYKIKVWRFFDKNFYIPVIVLAVSSVALSIGLGLSCSVIAGYTPKIEHIYKLLTQLFLAAFVGGSLSYPFVSDLYNVSSFESKMSTVYRKDAETQKLEIFSYVLKPSIASEKRGQRVYIIKYILSKKTHFFGSFNYVPLLQSTYNKMTSS